MSAHHAPGDDLLMSTRVGLHAIVEGVLAGPQHRASATIRLAVEPGSIQTIAEPRLRLTATTLSGPDGEASLLESTSQLALAAAIGVTAGPPVDVYPDSTGIDLDQPLVIDADTALALLDWFAVGAAALLNFAPEAHPVLWPEHFDLAITADGVDYGVSPGDGFSPVPYAYVGTPSPVEDPFFDQPFGTDRSGAIRSWTQTPDAAGISAFFTEARDKVLTLATTS